MVYEPNFCPTCGQKEIIEELNRDSVYYFPYLTNQKIFYCKNENCGLTYFVVDATK